MTRPSALEPGQRTGAAGAGLTTIGVLVALCCVGFAVVNVVFEATGHFDRGRYAAYADAFTLMNWLVVGLKLLGAAVAVMSLLPRSGVPPPVLTVLLWGGFATLALYGVGSLVQAVGMALGVTGSIDDIDLAGVVYVAFFLVVASGFGALAVSYSRRHGMPPRLAVLGALGAPLLLVLLLSVMPWLLAAVGVMPPP